MLIVFEKKLFLKNTIKNSFKKLTNFAYDLEILFSSDDVCLCRLVLADFHFCCFLRHYWRFKVGNNDSFSSLLA